MITLTKLSKGQVEAIVIALKERIVPRSPMPKLDMEQLESAIILVRKIEEEAHL